MSADENTFRYEVTADMNAPVERVWRAWTDDAEYEAWSRSAPGSVTQDVRPGGEWSAVAVAPDGQEFPITGTYREVVENRLLDMGMDMPDGEQEVMRMEFSGLDDGRTRLTITQDCASPEARDQSEQGSRMLLDWCAEYVSES